MGQGDEHIFEDVEKLVTKKKSYCVLILADGLREFVRCLRFREFCSWISFAPPTIINILKLISLDRIQKSCVFFIDIIMIFVYLMLYFFVKK